MTLGRHLAMIASNHLLAQRSPHRRNRSLVDKMTYKTIIPVSELAIHLDDPDWVIVDCRFSLANTERGLSDYLDAHIPGAVYAHLDEDLSAQVVPGETGRHPLPSVEVAARVFSKWGIDQDVQVVVYDDAGGALAAVRVWWMLRWLGHDAVAVLDGGWQAWRERGYPLHGGVQSRPWRQFIPSPRPELIATSDDVDSIRRDPAYRLVDARANERYHGQNETIDPVAGHIPGAISFPYTDNLKPDSTFLPIEQLRSRYQAMLGDVPPENAVFYCGSGVTSVHNILAMQHAGLGEGRLYVGSWSEWITDSSHPVTT